MQRKLITAKACAGEKLLRAPKSTITIINHEDQLSNYTFPLSLHRWSSFPRNSPANQQAILRARISKMVKLQEVEDEHFTEKTGTTKKDALLESDNDDDYTDTGMAFLYDLNVGMFT